MVIDNLKIASPCTADWDSMAGDDRVRFCGQCKKHVYNLSAMTRREAEALLVKTQGQMCARFYARADGTALTEDCPVGLRARATRLRRRVSWAVSGLLGFAGTALAQHPAKPDVPVQIETEEKSALTGTVKDKAGSPVSRAVVTLLDQTTGATITTVADERGVFRCKRLVEASWIGHDILLEKKGNGLRL